MIEPKQFITAGRAVFTIHNIETGTRLTYKVNKIRGCPLGEAFFVSVLSGPNNKKDYTYLGIIDAHANSFFRTRGTKINENAVSMKSFKWLFKKIWFDIQLPQCIEFLHEGKCCRCGRELTVPKSIKRGIGSICASAMGL